MNKINYDAEMRRMLADMGGGKLLLQACCAPCASHCLSELFGKMQLGVYFYNPNLSDAAEYAKREEELLRLVRETGWATVEACSYSPEDFAAVAAGYEAEAEGGARCTRCFRLRLTHTALAAKRLGYDAFATTLTLSPLKDAERINRIGAEIARETGVRYLPSDFKKRGGYQHSLELSKAFGLYRQNYCGCVYSMRPSEQK